MESFKIFSSPKRLIPIDYISSLMSKVCAIIFAKAGTAWVLKLR